MAVHAWSTIANVDKISLLFWISQISLSASAFQDISGIRYLTCVFKTASKDSYMYIWIINASALRNLSMIPTLKDVLNVHKGLISNIINIQSNVNVLVEISHWILWQTNVSDAQSTSIFTLNNGHANAYSTITNKETSAWDANTKVRALTAKQHLIIPTS